MANPVDELCIVDGCNQAWVLSFETKIETTRVCEWHAYLMSLKNEKGEKVEVKTKTVVQNQMR